LCLMDFGVSDIAVSATVFGQAGTPGYAAPEVDGASRKDRNGARIADIYSFGVVLDRLANACVSAGVARVYFSSPD
jgi:serine/threonine protein kinase